MKNMFGISFTSTDFWRRKLAGRTELKVVDDGIVGRDFGIGDGGARALAKALKGNSTLVLLDLSKKGLTTHNDNPFFALCRTLAHTIGNEGAGALAEALEGNCTLRYLDLGRNAINGWGVRVFGKVLQGNTVLASLNLENNGIGDDGACSLAEGLRVNSTLKLLRLTFNTIGNMGVQALAEALKHNVVLSDLNLRWNSFDVEGVLALADMLRVNSTLSNLDLKINSIGRDGARALLSVLELNPSVEALELSSGTGDDLLDDLVVQIRRAVASPGLNVLNGQNVRSSYEVEPKQLVRGEFLGSGGFGTVFEGTYQKHTRVALKVLNGSDLVGSQLEEAVSDLEREMAVWSQLPYHANVLPLMGWCREPLCLVTTFMARGTAKNYLKSLQPPYESRAVHRLLFQVALGMNHLHSRPTPILHLDLKGDNILVDEIGIAKVADFGLSKIRATASLHSTNRGGGTTVFKAPETFARPNPKPGTATDVYAFGVTMWELFSLGEIPLLREARLLGPDAFGERIRTDPGFRPQRPYGCPDATWGLMQRCWAMDAAERPRFEEVADELKAIFESL
ncbi:kinase-like domain-containing protein [Hyaloraphidium curvatum]|nr:kinase-like domain-containing protein [Hyaloraphidium curvatum]